MSESRARPNILFFFPDGMQAKLLESGSPCHAPNFRKLLARGVQVTHAYTPLPTCSPARASLMTGLLPHNHGVLQVEHCVDNDQCVLRPDKPHWAQSLSNAGYRTGYFGKWHIERTQRLNPFGWQVDGGNHSSLFAAAAKETIAEHALPIDPKFSRWQNDGAGYKPYLHYGVTDTPLDRLPVSVPEKLASRFLDDVLAKDQPWCCAVSFSEPNESLIASRETISRYDVSKIELPASLNDDYAGRPNIYRRTQQIWKNMTRRQWQEMTACYYARVTEIDELFGRLISKIEAAGKLDNTIVIISSDHGRYMGAHGMEAHNVGAAEELYRIPMVAAGPGLPRGMQAHARVALQDLCPTILELAGLPGFGHADSTSFANTLRQPPASATPLGRGFSEYFGNRYILTQRIAWDGPWKLVYNGFDYDELYNLDDDPHELRNLIHDPAQKPRIETMMKFIWRRIRETGDKALTEAQYYTYHYAPVGPDAIE